MARRQAPELTEPELETARLILGWRLNGLTVRQIAALLKHARGLSYSRYDVRRLLAAARALARRAARSAAA